MIIYLYKEGELIMKFCEHCGGKLENNPEFCPNCGAKIEKKHQLRLMVRLLKIITEQQLL